MSSSEDERAAEAALREFTSLMDSASAGDTPPLEDDVISVIVPLRPRLSATLPILASPAVAQTAPFSPSARPSKRMRFSVTPEGSIVPETEDGEHDDVSAMKPSPRLSASEKGKGRAVQAHLASDSPPRPPRRPSSPSASDEHEDGDQAEDENGNEDEVEDTRFDDTIPEPAALPGEHASDKSQSKEVPVRFVSDFRIVASECGDLSLGASAPCFSGIASPGTAPSRSKRILSGPMRDWEVFARADEDPYESWHDFVGVDIAHLWLRTASAWYIVHSSDHSPELAGASIDALGLVIVALGPEAELSDFDALFESPPSASRASRILASVQKWPWLLEPLVARDIKIHRDRVVDAINRHLEERGSPSEEIGSPSDEEDPEDSDYGENEESDQYHYSPLVKALYAASTFVQGRSGGGGRSKASESNPPSGTARIASLAGTAFGRHIAVVGEGTVADIEDQERALVDVAGLDLEQRTVIDWTLNLTWERGGRECEVRPEIEAKALRAQECTSVIVGKDQVKIGDWVLTKVDDEDNNSHGLGRQGWIGRVLRILRPLDRRFEESLGGWIEVAWTSHSRDGEVLSAFGSPREFFLRKDRAAILGLTCVEFVVSMGSDERSGGLFCRYEMDPNSKSWRALDPELPERTPYIDLTDGSPPALNMLDVCCGAGGASIGLEWDGAVRSTYGIEMEPRAAATYQLGHPHARCLNADLNALVASLVSRVAPAPDIEDRGMARLLQSKNVRVPSRVDVAGLIDEDVEVLFASLPCPTYSTATTSSSTAAVVDLQRALLASLCSLIEVKKPELFLMENVRGFGTKHLRRTGPDQQQGTPEQFLTACLLQLDYNVKSQELHADEHGSAQARSRLFVIAWRPSRPEPFFPVATFARLKERGRKDASDSTRLPKAISISEAISDLPSYSWDLPSDALSPPSMSLLHPYVSLPANNFQASVRRAGKMKVDRISTPGFRLNVATKIFRTPPGAGPNTSVPESGEHGAKYARLDGAGSFPTLLTHSHPNSFTRCIHPTERRVMTAREQIRSMGFPDDYEFVGPDSEVKRQVGNAVDVTLARALGRMIRDWRQRWDD